MVRKVLNKHCHRCSASFCTYEPTLLYCNDDCRKKHIYEVKFNHKSNIDPIPCANCGRVNNKKNYCGQECRESQSKKNDREQRALDNFNKPTSNRYLGMSFSERQKCIVKAKLYDPFYVNRIIRGIK